MNFLKNLLIIMFFLALNPALFAQNIIFHDNFSEETLDSSWTVRLGSGFGSGGAFSIISGTPGLLRYTLTNDGKTLQANSLWIYRQFSGDDWQLDMKVRYSMVASGQGRQLSFHIFFDEVSGVPDSTGNHIHWFRDRDFNRNQVSLSSNVDSTVGAKRFNLSILTDDINFVRITREGNTISVKRHAVNSTEFTTIAEYIFPEALGDKQFVLISGSSHAGESPNNIAEYDYITVTNQGSAPTVLDDAYTTPQNTVLSVSAPEGVLKNDSDEDGDSLTAVDFSNVMEGAILEAQPDGAFEYTPKQGFSGNDTFTYKANDGSADSTSATVTLTVTPVISKCRGVPATIVGTAGNDTLIGTSGNDVIIGLAGDDFIKGNGGKDLICGGKGNDVLRGGQGKDRLYGDLGNDRLYGGRGRDKLYGGKGNDKLRGGKGNDELRGAKGNDDLRGGAGNHDFCRGGSGVDIVQGCEL